MVDHADEEDDGVNVFVYMGGRAPQYVTHVRIDKSVDVIEENAFRDCEHLVHVETHDGIRRVGNWAFRLNNLLRRINLRSVVEIGRSAFWGCENLESVEFGDKLETIGWYAFKGCISIKHLKLPSAITIELQTFCNCKALIDIELSERLETIETHAFIGCERLQRIVIPLKRNLFSLDRLRRKYKQFDGCDQLKTVDLVGGAHTKTVASLHMESWRTEMIAEINRINQVLPNTPANNKAEAMRQWMESVIDKMDRYKAEHYRYVEEGIICWNLLSGRPNLVKKKRRP